MYSIAKKQRSFALLDLILWGVLIIVLAITVIRYYQSAHHAVKIRKGITLTQAILQGAAKYQATHASFKGLTSSWLCQQKLLSSDHCVDTHLPVNPWGGHIVIKAQAKQYRLLMDHVPRKVCYSMQHKLADYSITCQKAEGAMNLIATIKPQN